MNEENRKEALVKVEMKKLSKYTVELTNIETKEVRHLDIRALAITTSDFIMPIFADDAINTQDSGGKPTIEAFGSTAENGSASADYTDDAQTIVSTPAWIGAGWWDASISVAGPTAPLGSDFNGMGNAFSKAIINATNHSMLPYNADRVYNIGDTMTYPAGQTLWASTINNNIGNQPTSLGSSNWRPVVESLALLSSGVAVDSNFSVTWSQGGNSISMGAVDIGFLSLKNTTLNPFVDYAPQSISLSSCPAPNNAFSVWYITYSYNNANPSTPIIGWKQQPSWQGTDQDNVILLRVIVLNNAGTKTIANSAQGVIRMPWIRNTSLNASSNPPVLLANVSASSSANLTLSSSNARLSYQGINYGSTNPYVKNIPSSNPLSFYRLSPAINISLVFPTATTLVDPTQYWNGTALVAVGGGANQSTVQRILLTTTGNFVVQYGEATYPDLTTAEINIFQAPFTTLFTVPGDAQEVGRFAVVKNATNLTDRTQAIFISIGTSSGTGGGGGGVTDHNLLSGLQGGTSASNYFGHSPDGTGQTDKFLKSNGGQNPIYSPYSLPSSSGASGSFMQSNGSNIIMSSYNLPSSIGIKNTTLMVGDLNNTPGSTTPTFRSYTKIPAGTNVTSITQAGFYSGSNNNFNQPIPYIGNLSLACEVRYGVDTGTSIMFATVTTPGTWYGATFMYCNDGGNIGWDWIYGGKPVKYVFTVPNETEYSFIKIGRSVTATVKVRPSSSFIVRSYNLSTMIGIPTFCFPDPTVYTGGFNNIQLSVAGANSTVTGSDSFINFWYDSSNLRFYTNNGYSGSGSFPSLSATLNYFSYPFYT